MGHKLNDFIEESEKIYTKHSFVRREALREGYLKNLF